MKYTYLKYHRKGIPVPNGWSLVDDFSSCHHGEYAVLIRQDSKEPSYRVERQKMEDSLMYFSKWVFGVSLVLIVTLSLIIGLN